MKKIILALMLSVVPLTAYAQSQIEGAGVSKCSTYNNSDIKPAYFTWVEGFMGGLNMMRASKTKEYIDLTNSKFDSVAQEEFFKNLCLQNPDEFVFAEAITLYSEMGKMGLTVKQ